MKARRVVWIDNIVGLDPGREIADDVGVIEAGEPLDLAHDLNWKSAIHRKSQMEGAQPVFPNNPLKHILI